MREPR